jgi:biotin carboxylase
MSVTKIWFNRWFSTAYNIIDLIRKNKDGKKFEIFASHPNKYSLNLQNADVAFLEPNISREDYLGYCLAICEKFEINAFLPHHRSLLIAKNLAGFNEIGTKVLVSENTELLELIDDKGLLYEDIKPRNIIKVPEYDIVKTKDEFIKAYESIKAKGKVCFKPVNGVGGIGFRVIRESKNTIDNILNLQFSPSIYLGELLELLPEHASFQSIMVMEYLDGYEYSIDCLADRFGDLIVAIPRKKIDKYNRYLENNTELINLAKKISRIYKIPYAYNIQVRNKIDQFNLLEINARMSGGVHFSCESGFNIPYQAINILLDNYNTTNITDLKLDIMIGKIDTTIISKPIN